MNLTEIEGIRERIINESTRRFSETGKAHCYLRIQAVAHNGDPQTLAIPLDPERIRTTAYNNDLWHLALPGMLYFLAATGAKIQYSVFIARVNMFTDGLFYKGEMTKEIYENFKKGPSEDCLLFIFEIEKGITSSTYKVVKEVQPGGGITQRLELIHKSDEWRHDIGGTYVSVFDIWNKVSKK
jgi:hypothetical protein